jgi:hypothetical protein
MLDNLHAQLTSPEAKEVLAKVAVHITELSSRALLGQDITQEMRHITAQTANLSSTELSIAQNVIGSWVQRTVFAVVAQALATI